jgi:hypothetical protein
MPIIKYKKGIKIAIFWSKSGLKIAKNSNHNIGPRNVSFVNISTVGATPGILLKKKKPARVLTEKALKYDQ